MKATTSRLILLSFLLALTAGSATSQELISLPAGQPDSNGGIQAASLKPLHITDRLSNSPEGREALRAFIRARDLGQLPARKSGTQYTVGVEKNFNVLTSVQTDGIKWISAAFTLVAENDAANVWIENSLSGGLNETQLAAVENVILNETPSGSFRPDKGIVENNNFLFGNPPNYDGDGKVDILMFDIFEGTDECCVLGFVTATDLDPSNAGTKNGNQADVLYVDIKDGIDEGVEELGWVISHEYQHLINYNYQDDDTAELPFYNEGQSEWASVVNGYYNRGIYYLQNRNEHNTPLASWRENQSIGVLNNDYQRAGLLVTYLADRVGAEAAGRFTQARANTGRFAIGKVALEVVLSELGHSFGDMLVDFHTANFVNDRTLGGQFGYSLPARQQLGTASTTTILGTTTNSSELKDVTVLGGAVHYVTWKDVGTFTIKADVLAGATEPELSIVRGMIGYRLYLKHADGSGEIVSLEHGETKTIEGDFRQVTLIIASKAAQVTTPARLDVSASWENSDAGGVQRRTTIYEDGTTAGQPYFALPGEAMQASLFPVPDRGRLSAVHFAPVYDNQFSNSSVPAGSPRDYNIKVWSVGANGLPGQELYSLPVQDSPTGTHLNFATGDYIFIETLIPDTAPVADLPDTVFVGVANAGQDLNTLALTSATNLLDDAVSYLYHPSFQGGWASFADIFVTENGQQNFVLRGRVLPLRVEFVIPTAAENDELPSAITLDQNYPNPFNPATSVSYSLPRSMHVRLAVYDALGRRVATLTDGLQASGMHRIDVNATGWSSGVYMYALETETQTLTRTMVVMK